MLLEELTKATPQFHKDRGPLKKALEAISATANAINDAIKEQDAQTQCWKVQDRLKGFDKTLAAPHRKYLCEGPLQLCVLRCCCWWWCWCWWWWWWWW